MGRKLKIQDHNASIYFKLKDEQKWEMVERLMTLPKYQHSRTALINDALDYGLPILIKEGFCEDLELDDEYVPYEPNGGNETLTAEQGVDIIELLKQTNLNASIAKSILCSLFHVKLYELKNRKNITGDFEKGNLQVIPDYLQKYVVQVMNKMKKGG